MKNRNETKKRQGMAHLEKMALVFNLNVNSHKVTVLKKVWDLEQCHLGKKIGVVINQF